MGGADEALAINGNVIARKLLRFQYMKYPNHCTVCYMKFTYEIDPAEHASFKSKCAIAGRTMVNVLRDLMRSYQPSPKAKTKKGARQ